MNESNRNPVDAADNLAAGRSRAEWTTPKLIRLRARDAESGSNPIVPEGQFAMGS